MKLKALLILKALVSIGFGILLLAIPEKLLSFLGISVGPGGLFMAREYGGALVGIFFLCWFARNAEFSKAVKAIILFGFVYDIVNLGVSLYAQFNNIMNALGWCIVGVYLVFTLGFGYFLIKQPK